MPLGNSTPDYCALSHTMPHHTHTHTHTVPLCSLFSGSSFLQHQAAAGVAWGGNINYKKCCGLIGFHAKLDNKAKWLYVVTYTACITQAQTNLALVAVECSLPHTTHTHPHTTHTHTPHTHTHSLSLSLSLSLNTGSSVQTTPSSS